MESLVKSYRNVAARSSPATSILLVSIAVGLTAVSALIMTRDPGLGLATGLAPIVIILLVRLSWMRLLAVIGGGLFILGSSSEVSASKLVYAGLIVFCAVVSGFRLVRDPPVFAHYFRPLVWMGLFLFAVMGIGFVASPLGGDLTTFGRQSLFYVLMVLGPVIGLDTGRDLRTDVVYPMIGAIGAFAAVGFAFDWLDRRGITSLDFGRVILSSLVLPALAFGLALALLFHARGVGRRLLWAIPVLTIPIAMLVTGTRTNLIIFGAIPAVLGRMRNARVPAGRMAIVVVVAGALGIAIFLTIAPILISDPGFLQSRIQASLAVLTGDGASDQSFAMRSAQYDAALKVIAEAPFFGVGLGYQIPITLDTPLLTVVRFGWIGTATIAVFLAVFCSAVYRSQRGFGPSVAHTAWWAFIVVVLLNIPFGTPLEDRGFGFAMLLASAAIASALSRPGARELEQVSALVNRRGGN